MLCAAVGVSKERLDTSALGVAEVNSLSLWWQTEPRKRLGVFSFFFFPPIWTFVLLAKEFCRGRVPLLSLRHCSLPRPLATWAGQASCGRQMKLATPPFCADRTLLLLSKEKRPKSLTCRLHCAKCRQTRRNCRKAAATETLTHLDDWLIARLCDETPLITHTHNIVFSAHTTFIFRSRIRDMATRFAHTRVSCLFVTSRRDPVVIEICGGSYYWSSLRFSISHRRGNDIT